MEDLNEKLTGLLTSPEGMAKLQTVMAALGGGTAPASMPESAAASAPAVSVGDPPSGSSAGMPDLAALTKLLPLLSGMGQENEDTRLLQALRPYLHGEREKRLDETMQLLRLLRLLPLLQEQGILGGNRHDG